MCVICEKYGITKSSYEAMLRNGVISTTFPAHEEIFIYYKQCLSVTRSKMDAVEKVCQDKRVSQTLVYKVISEFK
jgi:hypothetical protein